MMAIIITSVVGLLCFGFWWFVIKDDTAEFEKREDTDEG